jgi:hypothetical protein
VPATASLGVRSARPADERGQRIRPVDQVRAA